MTDKQILEELHRRLQDYCSSFRREGHLGVNRYDIKDFIEQEWGKRDEGARWAVKELEVPLRTTSEVIASTTSGED